MLVAPRPLYAEIARERVGVDEWRPCGDPVGDEVGHALRERLERAAVVQPPEAWDVGFATGIFTHLGEVLDAFTEDTERLSPEQATALLDAVGALEDKLAIASARLGRTRDRVC